jgi:hypothetical protein
MRHSLDTLISDDFGGMRYIEQKPLITGLHSESHLLAAAA